MWGGAVSQGGGSTFGLTLPFPANSWVHSRVRLGAQKGLERLSRGAAPDPCSHWWPFHATVLVHCSPSAALSGAPLLRLRLGSWGFPIL